MFSDRFHPEHYADGEIVEIRAQRGDRPASERREHVVCEELFSRALLVARAYDLHQLGSLDGSGPTELNKSQARRIAEELEFLRTVLDDSLLVPHLTAMQKVADFCWRTSEAAKLIIDGP